MLGIEELLLIKESNNEGKIIYFSFYNHDFVFRLISPKEYAKIKMLTITEEEFEDAVCQITLLYPNPEEYDFSICPLGGVTKTMSKYIVEKSMIFDDVQAIAYYEVQKRNLNVFAEQCSLYVKAAFPEYPLDEIYNWDYEKLLSMTAKAEVVLKLKGSNMVLTYNEEEIGKEKPKPTAEELRKNGIDPMFYYANEFPAPNNHIDYPVILGTNWNRGDLIDKYKKQIRKRHNNKRKLSRV